MIVYKATSKTSGKSYIGQSKSNINIRKNSHKHMSIKGSAVIFHKAIRKYGWKDFEWKILNNNIRNREEANKIETYWINYYSTYSKDGYNMTEGGYSPYEITEETRKKMSENNKGKNNFWYGKGHLLKGKNNPHYGIKHSEKSKRRIIDSMNKNHKVLHNFISMRLFGISHRVVGFLSLFAKKENLSYQGLKSQVIRAGKYKNWRIGIDIRSELMPTEGDYSLELKKTIIEYYKQKEIDKLNFIGLDLSLRSTGFSVVKNGKCIKFYSIKPKEHGDYRLKEVAMKITKDILEYDVSFVLMEGYAFSTHSRSVTILAELKGTLKSFFLLKGINYLEAAPTLVKKYATGNGNSKKENMMLYVFKKFGIDCKNSDEADSVALAFFAYNAFKYAKEEKDSFNKKEIETFETFLSLQIKKKKNKKSTHKQLALEIDDE